jgi:hypothetical protein
LTRKACYSPSMMTAFGPFDTLEEAKAFNTARSDVFTIIDVEPALTLATPVKVIDQDMIELLIEGVQTTSVGAGQHDLRKVEQWISDWYKKAKNKAYEA